jgi:hypothetical protein
MGCYNSHYTERSRSSTLEVRAPATVIRCPGQRVYHPRWRQQWLEQLSEPGLRRRAERLYEQLDLIQPLRQQARRELIAESRKYAARKLLEQIPGIGPVRAALLIAIMQTPHRFRTKRLLWAYSGLGLEIRSSGDHDFKNGRLQRSKKQVSIRGLNRNHNPELKNLFKSTALSVSIQPGTMAGVLPTDAGERHPAGDGATYPGAQDRRGCLNSVEERREFRS